jgi:transcriptional regulator with XRE-family HTH domain
MIVEIFAEVLKELRTEKGISQEELAFGSGLDRTFISLLERGKRQPTLSTIYKISEALKVSPIELISKIDIKMKAFNKNDDQ